MNEQHYTVISNAAVQGNMRAARRLAATDARPLETAMVRRAWHMSTDDRRSLAVEGMRATAVVEQSLRSNPDPSIDELAAHVEMIAANPWHTGPTRDDAVHLLNGALVRHSLPQFGMFEPSGDPSFAKVQSAARWIEFANDRDAIAAAADFAPTRFEVNDPGSVMTEPGLASAATLHNLVYAQMGAPGAAAVRGASASAVTNHAVMRRSPAAGVEL